MSACKGEFSAVCSLLCQLGITANYNGFFHAAYAVSLAIQNPNRLRLVTKRLYPEVAKRYVTNWKSVERNIRTVVASRGTPIRHGWRNCPASTVSKAHRVRVSCHPSAAFFGVGEGFPFVPSRGMVEPSRKTFQKFFGFSRDTLPCQIV